MSKGRYELHCEKWANGCGSKICGGARKVFGRGVLPCDILFIGEAPGESENALGKPFIGPAGKLMDHMIKEALDVTSVRLAFTNLVCCIPRDPESGGKAGQPPDEAVRSCQPRLLELIDMAKPQLVVCVGDLARDFVDEGVPGAYRHAIRLSPSVKRVHVLHPAAILRASMAHKGLLVQCWVVTLRNAYADLIEKEVK